MRYESLASEIREIRALALKGREEVQTFHEYLFIWGFVLAGQQLGTLTGSNRESAHAAEVMLAFAGCLATIAVALRQRQTGSAQTWRSEIIASIWVIAGCNTFLLDVGHELSAHWAAELPKAATAMLISLALAMTAAATRRAAAAVAAGLWVLAGFVLTLLRGHPHEQSWVIVASSLLMLVLYGVVVWRGPGNREA
jgi:hypothetical protein